LISDQLLINWSQMQYNYLYEVSMWSYVSLDQKKTNRNKENYQKLKLKTLQWDSNQTCS